MRGSASPQDRPHPQIIAGDLCTCNGPMWRGPFDNTILLTEYFCNEKGGILVLSQHLSDSATALGIEGMKSNFALSEYSRENRRLRLTRLACVKTAPEVLLKFLETFQLPKL